VAVAQPFKRRSISATQAKAPGSNVVEGLPLTLYNGRLKEGKDLIARFYYESLKPSATNG
jgi:hypothetical protein